MKIGILSMQRIHNYGSFLQALSLKHELEQRGNDVYFVDIEKGRQITTGTPTKRSLLSKIDKYFFKRLENYWISKKMDRIHVLSQREFLNVEKQLSSDDRYDMVVIGSDEVFNATVPSGWGFSKQLFGEIKNANKVVTYAACCGSTDVESAKKYGIDEEISECLSKIEQISVRDENTYHFVRALTNREPYLNVDPVFLADYDSYIPKSKFAKPYMLVYAYPNRIYDDLEIREIKSYAKKNGLRIVCVGMQQRWCKHNYVADAFELLRFFKDATCVVTDTFHGAVFSIKYNKQFVALIRESNSNKLRGLLEQFGLTDRCVNALSLESVLDVPIKYDAINEIIKNEQKKSAEYLDAVCGLIDGE